MVLAFATPLASLWPYAGLAGLLVVALGLWLLLGGGPRRRRACNKAQRLLEQGQWRQALELVQAQQHERLSTHWKGRIQNLKGQCQRAAGDEALRGGRYEESLERHASAAQLLNADPGEAKNRVVEGMLDEARRLFGENKEVQPIQDLLGRILILQSPCPAASFWQALCFLRQNQEPLALSALRVAQEQAGTSYLDPPLYLGALLLRAGQAQEALRVLSEANRVSPGCPFVTWQLGMAMVEAGSESGMATRVLQRAIGPQGLQKWLRQPQRAFVEGLPEKNSYVHRLASKYPFLCPVFGNNVAIMIRQGMFALGQAHYKAANYKAAAEAFEGVLAESPPTVPLLIALGKALARLERYEDAYKHLRTAFDREEPQTAFTAGYLALCGAKGKPSSPEDKIRNITWSLRLLAGFEVSGNREWAELSCQVHAEAWAAGLAVSVEDQVRLCNALASADATDPLAAVAYEHLFKTHPESLRPEWAWLFCRAAQQHGYQGERDLDLFAITFRDEPAARAFYDQRQWNFADVEATYLERCAARQPGHFPDNLGPEYPGRGTGLLLTRSRAQEASGQGDAALASAEVLHKLAPQSPEAHDRLAYLHYRRGNLDAAAPLLQGWHDLEPGNPTPLLRRAVVEQQRNNPDGRTVSINLALDRCHGRQRAAAAFLGARLALQSQQADLAAVWLQTCLREQPDHADGLWCLAAVHLTRGDWPALAAHAPAMDRPDVTDPRFHYLAAVCHFAARDYARAQASCQRCASDPALEPEGRFLAGWAALELRDGAGAAAALEQVAKNPHSPSADHARALLGRLRFAEGKYDEAASWWQALDPARRSAWQFDEALRGTVFQAALQALTDGRYEQAADKLREAGKLGLRDKRLGPLLILALFQAGQRLLYQDPPGERPRSDLAIPESSRRRRDPALPEATGAAFTLLPEG